MKAILVFDVNDFAYEAIEQYFTGIITLHLGNDGYLDFKVDELKPVPQKVWSLDLIERYNVDESKYTQSELAQLAYGYNTCIDEILGETE